MHSLDEGEMKIPKKKWKIQNKH